MMRLPLTCVILLVLGTACVPDAPEQVSESIETRYANAEPVLSPTWT
jgi:hypothetical protein